jgi:predicted transcriptional regulator
VPKGKPSAYDNSAQAHAIRRGDADALLLEGEAKAPRSFQPTDCWLLRLHSATLLLYLQARLKITPSPFNVLLHLVQHWWDAEKAPHPKIETIARRMGKSEHMVLRYLGGLEKAGLIKREHRYRGKQKQISSAYRRDGLRERLIELEPGSKGQGVSRQKAKDGRDSNSNNQLNLWTIIACSQNDEPSRMRSQTCEAG